LTSPPARGLVPHVFRPRFSFLRILCVFAGASALAGAANVTADRAAADAAIAAIQADEAQRRIAQDPLSRAQRALQRADGARGSADHEHGALLEALAREWAESGVDLVRTARAEAEANEQHRRASEAESKARRARTLIEETVARRTRAAEALKAMESAGVPVPPKGAPKPKVPSAPGSKP